jgi:hypothetical protein
MISDDVEGEAILTAPVVEERFLAVRDIVQDNIQTFQLRQSVIVMMLLNPLSEGSGPMKSIVTESPCSSGTKSGCNGLIGLIVIDSFLWHSMHDST